MLCRKLTFTWIFLLALFYAQAAVASCALHGLVEEGGVPIANAKVSVFNDNNLLASVTTEADGRFKVSYPEPARSAPTVKVTLTASGYANDNRNLLRSPDQKCPRSEVHFSLSTAQGDTVSVKAPSLTIYVSPFELFGVEDDSRAKQFNADLPDFIFHKIMAYKSGLALDAEVGDVTISSIEQKLSPAKGSEIRRLGHQMGALAMVVGELEILPGENGGIEIASSVKPIPIFEDFEINIVVINDLLPSGKLRPSKVGRNLNDHWGKQAVIAYVLQQLSVHQGEWEASELDQINQILIGVKSTIRDETDPFKSMVDELLALIKEKRV